MRINADLSVDDLRLFTAQAGRTVEPRLAPTAATGADAVDLSSLARALAARGADTIDELLEMLLDQIEDLRGDSLVTGRLRASLESNASTLQHIMEQHVDLELIEPPAGALQWAIQLAQRGVPLSTLWRAYHLCAGRYFRICFEELVRYSSGEELVARTIATSDVLHTYADRMCQRIADTYATERRRWLKHDDIVRAERVTDLLAGRIGEAACLDTDLHYRLAGRHVGLIVWDRAAAGLEHMQLRQLVTRCAERCGCRESPLIVLRDQSTVWAWLPVFEDHDEQCARALEAALADTPRSIRAAIGDPGVGIDGFRRTHRQATIAQSVAVAATDRAMRLTPYRAVAGLGFLCQDMARAREWVGDTLGTLALDDEAHCRLRESLRAFLDTGGSLSAAAGRLRCHKNTVQYRIRRAEEELGRNVRESRVDLELALLACRWLGTAVLTQRPAS